MKLHLGRYRLSLILLIGIFPMPGQAVVEEPSPNLVRVEYYQDNLADYRDRRENHGFMLGFDYTEVVFDKYMSALDNQMYLDLYGETSLPLIGISLDYKYNFSLGSVSLGLTAGFGSVGSPGSGEQRDMEVFKYGLGFKYIADNILPEPYIAPYFGMESWIMNITEKRSGGTDIKTFNGNTAIGFSYAVGILVQLDWLDPSTDANSNFSWGLENTFLDIYAMQFLRTMDEVDPDTSTDFTLGGGLRFEF